MVVLALASAVILLYENVETLNLSTVLLLDHIDIGIALIFLSEFLIKFYASRKRWKYFKYHWWELLASIPISTPATQSLRLLRLLRLVRLLRLNEGVREILNYLSRFVRDTHLLAVATVWLVVVLAGASSFYWFEHVQNSRTFFDSLWWAVSTITTVGYGDVYPVTTAGRIVGMLLMVCGIGTTGTLTALIATFLVHNKGSDGDRTA